MNPMICEFEDVKPLVDFLPELRQIDLEETPLSQKSDYRQKMFDIFPKLEILDNLEENGNEIKIDEKELHLEEEVEEISGEEAEEEEEEEEEFMDKKIKKLKK